MTTQANLEKIAHLAYIELEEHNVSTLVDDFKQLMGLAQQLTHIDTESVSPLFHPLDAKQHLRADVVTETNRVDDLEKIAPAFAEGLYLVPTVIDAGK